MTQLAPTEHRNPATVDLDLLPTDDLVTALLDEERAAAAAAHAAGPAIAVAVELAHAALARGGRLHYFGAGASGRLAVLDATELRPTFGVAHDFAVPHFPGGAAAVLDSGIDREDDAALGEADASRVAAGDVVIGVSASGTTAYVRTALAASSARGAATILITSNPTSPLTTSTSMTIVLDTGPEALTGSTRLKAGTATKIVLGTLSTAIMVRLGRTHSNLMVGMAVTNDKLRQRAIDVLREASGRDDDACRTALDAASSDLPTATVALLSGSSAEDAAAALSRAGSVRTAVAALAGDPP